MTTLAGPGYEPASTPGTPSDADRPAWPPETLIDLLRHRAAERATDVAYIFPLDVDDADPLAVTYADIDRRARAIGAWLASIAAPGERAFVFHPPGPDFVTSFFGALYAGLVAVPVYPISPNRLARTLPRLRVMLEDAGPAVAFAPAPLVDAAADLPSDQVRRLRWAPPGDIADASASGWRPPPVDARALAVLQYTSGSTATPRGVLLSHRNILANLAMLQESCGTTKDSVFSSWLPLAHDMGLFGRMLAPVYVGGRSILTPPELFLQRPIEWLAMICRLGATCFGGPNFAYDSLVRAATPAAMARLNLGRWDLATIGTEFVHAQTLDRFAATFAPAGFRPEVFFNGYGLAEATLLVCGGRRPSVRRLDTRALEQNVARLDPSEGVPARTIVGSGRPPGGVRIAIVDPATLVPRAPEEVGEIWVAGAHVGLGYWRRPAETAETFQAYTSDGRDGPWLRTGDLGFLHDGELFVTGRLKDLIITRGRNLYPRDLELTVESCHPALRPGCGAAFSVTEESEERLVILQELRDGAEADAGRIVAAIRERLADEHEVLAHAVMLLREGTLLKTTSGKVQRAACRAAYLEGTLELVASGAWGAGLESPAEFVPPRTATERKLAAIWRRVLDADRIGIHDNFVDLGGQSIQANLAIAGVQRLFGVELESSHFFSETATVAELARVIDRLRGTRAPGSRRRAAPRRRPQAPPPDGPGTSDGPA